MADKYATRHLSFTLENLLSPNIYFCSQSKTGVMNVSNQGEGTHGKNGNETDFIMHCVKHAPMSNAYFHQRFESLF